MDKGKFVISLDFELNWGAAEKNDLSSKKEYFKTTRESIPHVLVLFKKYDIHATWATVGFLFAKNKKQLIEFCPELRPTYKNSSLSYYNFIDLNKIGLNEEDDPYHYANSLISEIIKTPNQELATHTFSHYYCNEEGQNIKQFEADLKAAQSLSKENFNIELKSLVFPRNQFNSEYIEIAIENGIKVVRSNPDVWFWKKTSRAMAFARALDTLFSISKKLSFDGFHNKNKVFLLPASRFLRAYSKKEKILQELKFKRIKREMTYAAKNNKVYHLWWHPHNFGYEMEDNLIYLENILKHFKTLNEKFDFSSKSMIEMF
ncbi:hypothetical protein LPB03_07060 [Polaribacter vadi]|uniref:NodB homology domain-containing protein n=1 Tax=Polaribacter vadi TaxID=1774273 RepID=A0A1B8TZ80_9FLAO|nr:polysaccharide deacetylase family protein [Polaribacter vadi]AOW17238.1 hypothetical protein LPB03_07060 [Polaribacter vadi]OBY64835.1 hypothetical protein LPB3_05430 [Polaribacter vadi]